MAMMLRTLAQLMFGDVDVFPSGPEGVHFAKIAMIGDKRYVGDVNAFHRVEHAQPKDDVF